jgi:uncharacterized protein (DUF849 family)
MKVIISCAVTGSVHTPSMSPYLPVTAEEIAEDAIKATAAGASIIHLHARNPITGEPDQTPSAFVPILDAIGQRSSSVINITTGGAATMSVDERVQPIKVFGPELASLNMGSMNFGLFPMLHRFEHFQHAWEAPYLAGSKDRVFKNTFADIEHILSIGAQNCTRFEFECYDVGHLYTLAHFADAKRIEAPFFVQGVFGILGGIGAHIDDVLTMRRTAERLFGDALVWSVLGAGRHQLEVATLSLLLGGHVRVGLEDSLWLKRGVQAKSSADQVLQIRTVIESLGHQVATPQEAREILKLRQRRAA